MPYLPFPAKAGDQLGGRVAQLPLPHRPPIPARYKMPPNAAAFSQDICDANRHGNWSGNSNCSWRSGRYRCCHNKCSSYRTCVWTCKYTCSRACTRFSISTSTRTRPHGPAHHPRTAAAAARAVLPTSAR